MPSRICHDCGEFFEFEWRGQRAPRYCPDCAPKWARLDAQRRLAKPQARIWHSPRWRRTRQAVFARDGYRCTECKRHRSQLEPGERLIADHVDGVLEGDPFDMNRIETVCTRCSGARDGGRESLSHRY